MDIKTFQYDVQEYISNHSSPGLMHEELEKACTKALKTEHAKQNRSFSWTQKHLNVIKNHVTAALGIDEDYFNLESINKIRKELGESSNVTGKADAPQAPAFLHKPEVTVKK